MRRSLVVLLATALLGYLLFALPASQAQTINSCITKSTGQIRIVTLAKQCKTNEAPLSWNLTGPQGLKGDQGPTGATGPEGPQGPPPAPEPSNNQTRLLFPFVTNQVGFDTGITISNTTKDPFGTTAASGTCTLTFYGGSTPVVVETSNLDAGTTYANMLSVLAPYLQGYMIAVCDFPMAHGFYFISDVGARNLAMGGNAIVLSSTRSGAVVESRGE